MSQSQPAVPARNIPNSLKSLTPRPALIAPAPAGAIAGSAGMAVAVTASQALRAAPVASPEQPADLPAGLHPDQQPVRSSEQLMAED
jgi:hypothetical protein